MSIDQQCAKQTEVLQEVCREGCLPRAQEVFEQEDVVMNSQGELEYARANTPDVVKKRERKKLVLGFDGYNQHNLAEVNDILSDVVFRDHETFHRRVSRLIEKRNL